MTKKQEPCLAKIGKYWERADFCEVKNEQAAT